MSTETPATDVCASKSCGATRFEYDRDPCTRAVCFMPPAAVSAVADQTPDDGLQRRIPRAKEFISEAAMDGIRDINQGRRAAYLVITHDVPKLLADLAAANATITELRTVLDRLVGHEDDPCLLDHHGYCQQHGLSSVPCATAEARKLLGGSDD
jgi:hypothetical protein